MDIYTRKGDDGTTGLLYGGRVRKDDPAPAAYGDVDEAQSAIGVARAHAAAAVPDEMVEKATIIGDAAYVKDRIAEYREAGVTSLNVSPLGDDHVGTIAALRDIIDG